MNCLFKSLNYKIKNPDSKIKFQKMELLNINYFDIKTTLRYIKYLKKHNNISSLFLPHFYIKHNNKIID